MKSPRRRVVVLFGGRSAEHEVSILSARNVARALDRSRFEPVLVGIDKQGRWRLADERALDAAAGDPTRLKLDAAGAEVAVRPYPADAPGDAPASVPPVVRGETAPPAVRGDTAAPALGPDDVVFPVLHGTFGEDGTVQGLLELAGVAYVGSGVLGSAVGMDKDVAKRLLRDAGLPVVDYRLVTAAAFARDAAACRAQAAELGFPLFVKPANAGSSVGVTKVRTPDALDAALRGALAFDRKVLCEKAVDAREIECAVLGNDEPEASLPGEVVVHHPDGFYSYAAKYVDAEGSSVRIPADLPADTATRVRALAVAAFRALELAGLARVDFFLDRGSGALFVNEVNTMPGFTAISMYPKMWEATGLAPTELITRLIALALERHDARHSLKTSL